MSVVSTIKLKAKSFLAISFATFLVALLAVVVDVGSWGAIAIIMGPVEIALITVSAIAGCVALKGFSQRARLLIVALITLDFVVALWVIWVRLLRLSW